MDQKVDAILANLQSRHDVISQNTKQLKAKWLITPEDDKWKVENEIDKQQWAMERVGDDYDAKVSEIRGLYEQADAGLTDIKARCDHATSLSYAPLPSQCGNLQTYVTQYQTSRATTKAKFDTAGAAMFPKLQ
jgi:hypothetical protein